MANKLLDICREIQNLQPKKMEWLKIALARSDEKGAYALRLILLTGARKNETNKANRQDFDWNGKILPLNRNCHGLVRCINLPEGGINILRKMFSAKANGRIFPGGGKK